jgi:hypothetical protein
LRTEPLLALDLEAFTFPGDLCARWRLWQQDEILLSSLKETREPIHARCPHESHRFRNGSRSASVGASRYGEGYRKNTTAPSTYPHRARATLDAVPRDTFGRQCVHCTADSPDALEAVGAWYRHALPGAIKIDVNKSGLYGRRFKLDAMKLSRGTDFLTIYQMPDQKSTSIELFKCTSKRATLVPRLTRNATGCEVAD